MYQVTFMQADACDEAAIQGVCEAAVQQEGRLDVFFANVCDQLTDQVSINVYVYAQAGFLGSRYDLTCEEETLENFMRVMKNNVASCVSRLNRDDTATN